MLSPISKAQEIGLSKGQTHKIKAITHAAQLELAKPQKSLEAAYAALSSELAKPNIDAAAALAELDKVLDIERAIKRRHLQMLLETNSKLQPEQRAKLLSLKRPKQKTKTAEIDPDALRKQIESMRAKDVAWRKIEWKTCLLAGLKASREQNKPIALWVFIDRPIDDKRC